MGACRTHLRRLVPGRHRLPVLARLPFDLTRDYATAMLIAAGANLWHRHATTIPSEVGGES